MFEGESEVNEAVITGESKPVAKKKNAQVIGGSINGSGSLKVEVEKPERSPICPKSLKWSKRQVRASPSAQGFADRAAFWLTILAITVGVLTLVTWLFLGKDFAFALERMVTVMVITCPHALGLAIPLVVAVVTSLSAKNGLLIQNRTAFEESFLLDTIVFDKTGTLTKGQFGVSDIVSLGEWEQSDILIAAASIEQNSEHSIAQGIINRAKEKNFL